MLLAQENILQNHGYPSANWVVVDSQGMWWNVWLLWKTVDQGHGNLLFHQKFSFNLQS